MIKKIKSYALSIIALLTLLVPVAVPALAGAASSSTQGSAGTCSNTASNVASGANLAAGGSSTGSVGCDSSTVSNSSVGKAASHIVSLFSIIVGAVSIIMIIYGGFRYITSGGDSGRVGNAKNTLIYAIIGLVIVALAQLIVHFVLNQASNVASS
jgi:ABC-type sugar transport system permease subunit